VEESSTLHERAERSSSYRTVFHVVEKQTSPATLDFGCRVLIAAGEKSVVEKSALIFVFNVFWEVTTVVNV